MHPEPAHLFQIGAFTRIQNVGVGLGFVQELADLLCARQVRSDFSQRANLFATGPGAALGHVGLRVPHEKGLNALKLAGERELCGRAGIGVGLLYRRWHELALLFERGRH